MTPPSPLECWLFEEKWGPWAPFDLAGKDARYASGSAFLGQQHWYYLVDRETFWGEVIPIPPNQDPNEFVRERVGGLMNLGGDLLCYLKRMPQKSAQYRYRAL
jgi:hypothetical protein